MSIKEVAFDVGNTLIRYNNPLNWKSLYKPALRQAMVRSFIDPTEDRLKKAEAILMMYNTRRTPCFMVGY